MPRYVRVTVENQPVWGRIHHNTIEVLNRAPYADGQPTGTILALEQAKLLAPVCPSKIICVGLNYALHVQESQSATHIPEQPVSFMKPPTAIIGPEENIVYPPSSARVDYEAELAVVIGKTARHVAETDAGKYIFGYTCLNDVTARDLQKKDGQWTRGKGFDTFCPVGPWIETELDHRNTVVESYLNGVRKQSGNTADMLFPVPFLVSYISEIMTLLPGDVISTGTPEGISPMQPGDTIEIRVAGIGSLVNRIVAAEPA
jgi:2-keto-4-pentenoate hydratase/2-oxohepta-3-ene-1,7-dioic acid hydratase in catechol pathway